MLLLNDEEFKIYPIDSYQTVIDRIAVKYASLPKYLKFGFPEPKLLQDFTGQIQVENILDEIINQEDVEFSQNFRNRIKRDYPHLNMIKDVEELYIAYNEMIQEVGESAILTAKGFTINVKDTWDKSDKIRNDFENLKRVLLKRVENHNTILTSLDGVAETFHTNFYFEKSRVTIDFGPQEQSMPEIFNKMLTTDHVPFIAFENIFKVHSNFTPDKKWVNTDTIYPEGYIVMKVDGERNIGVRYVKDIYQKFSNVIFAMVDGRLIANLLIVLGKRNILRPEFQRRALKVFGENYPKIITSVETNAVGIFYFPHQSLDTTILADMVMNDPKFYNIIAVDEAIRLSKVKNNVFMRTIYGSEAIAIQMNIGEKGELPPGILDKEPYLRVRVTKTTTQQRVKDLQKLVAKLITLYNENFQTVTSKYLFYLPNLVITPLATIKTRQSIRPVTLGEIAPEIFPPRYSRKCTKPPKIITDEEAAKTDKIVMEFPIFGESTKRNYICEYPKEMFPGLQDNKLENTKEFPLIPCCYVKDQRLVKGSKYNHYFKGEQLKKTTQFQDIFKSGKILAVGAIGVLPRKINNLFETIIPPTHQFMRRGMNVSRLSFLEAILTAKGVVNGFELDIMNILNSELKRFMTPEYAAAAKQELYHKSIDEILDIMKTGDLRATWFVNTFELVFNCNIFIFTDNDNGSLTVPDHAMCYYKLKPIKPTYFIYQHWGSEADLPDFPQCELMVMTPRENPRSQISMFPAGTEIPIKVFEVFKQLTSKFKFSEEIPDLQIRKVPIKFQIVDAYGKCRLLSTHYEGINMTLMTVPCPPFAKPLGYDIFRPSLSDVGRMIKHYGFQPVVQRKDHRTMRTREVVVLIGSLYGTYLVDDNDVLPGVDIEVGERFGILTTTPDSHPLTDMITLDKTSRVLAQNAIYVINKFLHGRKLTKDVLTRFSNEKVIFDQSIDYNINDMRPIFEDPTNRMITQNYDIIVQSIEVWKRLMFYVSMFYKRHKDNFLRYSSMVNIPHFFDDVSDYKVKTEEYLLHGKMSVESLILKKRRDILRHAVSAIIPKITETYFFKNDVFGNKVFMAQNAPTYLHANYVLYTWRYENYNPGVNFITKEESDAVLKINDVVTEADENEDESEGELSLLDLDLEDLLQEDIHIFNKIKPQRHQSKEEAKEEAKEKPDLEEKPILPEVPLIDFAVYKYKNTEDITLLRSNGSTKDFVLAYMIEGVPSYTVLMTG